MALAHPVVNICTWLYVIIFIAIAVINMYTFDITIIKSTAKFVLVFYFLIIALATLHDKLFHQPTINYGV